MKIKKNFKITIVGLGLILSIFFIIDQPKSKPKKLNEKYYQTRLCNKLNGVIEYRLKDKTRIDCLTNEYAIEVDWAKKWAEGIGQSLYYAQMTNKKPAVGLIVGDKDLKYLKRLMLIANKYNIRIFEITKE